MNKLNKALVKIADNNVEKSMTIRLVAEPKLPSKYAEKFKAEREAK